MYAYGAGDPANNFDPSGLMSHCGSLDGESDAPESGGVGCTSGGGHSTGNSFPDWANAGPCKGTGPIDSFDPEGSVWCNVFPNEQPPDNGSAVPLCPLVGLDGDYTLQPNSTNPIHPFFAPDAATALDSAIAIMNNEGIIPQINSGFRTRAEQAGVPHGSRPAAARGSSWHEVGEAVDIQLSPNSDIGKLIIAAMTGAGFTYGAAFHDDIHFQLPAARVLSDGTVKSGSPSRSQVANCEREHPYI